MKSSYDPYVTIIYLSYKPYTSGVRHFLGLSKSKSCSRFSKFNILSFGFASSGGRSSSGRAVCFNKKKYWRRSYRLVDYTRRLALPSFVVRVEYDPNRTSNVALVIYLNKSISYILCGNNMNVGDVLENGLLANSSALNNALPITNFFNSGSRNKDVYNVELYGGRGGSIARSAGTYCTILKILDSCSILKQPSGTVISIPNVNYVTIGRSGNLNHKYCKLGKAGRSVWLGRRPRVRGVAMNPVDHPHGGGEGKSSGGRNPLVNFTGRVKKGVKTTLKSRRLNQLKRLSALAELT